jgi:hypothetical protein
MLNKSGDLLMAGPFIKVGELRGSFLSTIQSEDEVKALYAEELPVQVFLLEVYSHPWPDPAEITFTSI